jgi:hypothetical protein
LPDSELSLEHTGVTDSGIRDTTAYKITRLIMDHVYGEDEPLSDAEFVALYRIYLDRGGTWRGIQNGDMSSVKVIEDLLDGFVNYRRARDCVNSR